MTAHTRRRRREVRAKLEVIVGQWATGECFGTCRRRGAERWRQFKRVPDAEWRASLEERGLEPLVAGPVAECQCDACLRGTGPVLE